MTPSSPTCEREWRITILVTLSPDPVQWIPEAACAWNPHISLVFAGDPESQDWSSLVAEYCRKHAAAGGLFWTDPQNSRRIACCLLYAAGGHLLESANITAGGFAIHVAAGAALASGVSSTRLSGNLNARFLGRGTAFPVREMEILHGGELRFLTEAAVQPEMKYFYGKPVQGISYPLWSAIEGVRVNAHPSRPLAARITPQGTGPFPTNLRTATGNTITLTPVPPEAGYALEYNPVADESPAYAVITGPWQLNAQGATAVHLMCGLSGLEYVSGPGGTAFQFAPGPAYAPGFGPGGIAGAPLLTDQVDGGAYPVRTPWAYPLSSESLYFAQPDRAALYTPGPTGGLLNLFEIPAGSFPQGPTQSTFPLAPYGQVEGDPATVVQFEASVLSPARRNAISSVITTAPGPRGLGPDATLAGATCMTGPAGPGPTGPIGPTGPFVYATTPQGVLSTFDTRGQQWETLTLASTNEGSQQLQLTELKGPLRSAMLTNNLFLVISSADKLRDAASVNYKLTGATMAGLINEAGVPREVVYRVGYLQDILYESLAYFETVLKDGLGECLYNKYGSEFLAYCEFFELTIQGWTFQLEPHLWSRFGTIAILKFSDRPLEDLAGDLSAWVAADAFNDDLQKTQQKLQAIIADAKEQAKTHSVFDYFVHTVLANQQANGSGAQLWNGILFLNCVTPLNSLPPQLAALAAGIDPSAFYIHHAGINLSPVSYQGGRVIQIGDSSVFGLIYYQNPGDLEYQSEPYQFKVLSLTVLFANSQITSFDSQIELLTAQLFGERSTLQNTQHGDNLILQGSYQDHDGEKSYVFLDTGAHQFLMSSQVLFLVEINRVQLATVLTGGTVQSRFLFWGNMQFLSLEGFDAFSFGPGYDTAGNRTSNGAIAFSNLSVKMTFDPNQPDQKPVFAFDASQVALDMAQSSARAASLYQGFPLTLTALVQGQDKESPLTLGFIPVQAPLQTQLLSYPWFGLVFSLNLGSAGALAAKAGFTASLIVAWSPSSPAYKIFLGIQLPSSQGGSRQITIEGPLALKIGAIQFQTGGKGEYYLRFQNITLSLLALSFPPGGQTEVLLFGDPQGGARNTLGWYAAYDKDKTKTQPKLLTGK